jgi:hypothetical protein
MTSPTVDIYTLILFYLFATSKLLSVYELVKIPKLIKGGRLAMVERRNERASQLSYFFIGLGLGAGAALMLSPKTRMGTKDLREAIAGGAVLFASRLAREIREEIAEVTRRGYGTAQDIANELTKAGKEISGMFIDEIKQTITNSTNRILDAMEEAKQTVDRGIDQLSEAIEVGKQAYVEEKHRREVEMQS